MARRRAQWRPPEARSAEELLRGAKLSSQDRSLLLNSFPEFVRQAWRFVDGSTLVWGWYMELLCRELQRWAQHDVRNIILSVPPGFSKSLCAAVLLPAWIWLRNPSNQFLSCTHNATLALRDCVRTRNLIRSSWYQDLVAGAWALKEDQDVKSHYETTLFGKRQAIGGKTGLTGQRGDDIIVDDPVDINPRKPPGPEELRAATEWVQYIRATRINDPKTARCLLIAQRCHEDDPTGVLLREELDEWHVVYFDLEYDPAMPHRHPDDPRTEAGELLFPERMGGVEVGLRRKRLGPEQYSAQCQQQPVIVGGNIVHGEDLPIIESAADKYQHIIISWDLAFTGEETSSWVVGSVWGINSPESVEYRRFHLLDLVRIHADYPASKAAVRALALRWPEASFVVIEDKANGPATLSELKHLVANVVPFNPAKYGDKIRRLRAVSPIFRAGQVALVRGDWNAEYIDELTRAPKISRLDQVDSTTQALLGAQYHLVEWTKACEARRRVALGGW